MKINLSVETVEFDFIKHAIEQHTKELIAYMDSMHRVAVALDKNPKDIEEDFDEAYAKWKAEQEKFEKEAQAFGPEKVVKAPKRRGRPPAKKRGRPAKAKV